MWVKINSLLMICVMICLTSCSPKIIKHPDTPAVILGGSGTLTIGVYSKEKGQIIYYGKVDADDYIGWWLLNYDADTVLQKLKGNKELTGTPQADGACRAYR